MQIALGAMYTANEILDRQGIAKTKRRLIAIVEAAALLIAFVGYFWVRL